MSKLTKIILGDLAAPGRSLISGPFGSDIGQRFFKDKGVPVIRGNNLTTNFKKFIDEGFVFVTNEKANELKADAIAGDILFTAAGTIGQVGQIPDNAKYSRYVISNKQIRFRVNKEKADPDFIFYWLASPWIFNAIGNRNTGSTVPLINLGIIKSLPVLLPNSIDEQKKISRFLSSIDKKIELNNRINAELEAIAKTLYDYWFVQFDFPDSKGKPYKTSGGRMVYNPTLKREIPEGWSDMLIENCADLFRGVTYGKEDVLTNNNSAIGVLRATNITGNQVDIDALVYVPYDLVSESQILKKFETLIVMSSGSTEHIGKNGIYYFEDKCAFGAFCSKLEIHKEYTFYLNTFLNTVWFKTYIKNQCLGTNINNLTNEHIKKCALVKPDSTTLKIFDTQTKPLYEKIANNCKENVQLKKLRDWLLPMLMNGQVTVKG